MYICSYIMIPAYIYTYRYANMYDIYVYVCVYMY